VIGLMKKLTLGALVCVVLGSTTGTADAYDRTPLHLSGMKPDGWGQTLTGAEAALRARYDDVKSVYCGGVFMNGYTNASSAWTHGTVRFWDKLYCAVRTNDFQGLVMVFDQKGKKQNAYQIYRVKPIPNG
jgi:hypothetical protein